ncbi:hypothetical protein [Spirosoma rigui]|uniref:hypothetical protein n=1 Tax=Spirosoma rigui TaxID=564064 RepID=UPI0009B0E312|nr:hypothetical protein [Spirosoma rigui]
MKTNNISTDGQATSWALSYLSVNLRLTTQPFGENGDSNFEVVMNALTHYKSHLLEHAKRNSGEIAAHGANTVQLGNLHKIEQVSELQGEMQLRMIMADQHRVRPRADQSDLEDSPLPAADPAGKPTLGQTPLQTKYDTLHESIDAFFLEEGVQSHMDRLSQLWIHWSVNGISDGQGDPKGVYQISSKSLDDTFSVMRLMCFLTSLSETWSSIRRLVDKSEDQAS